MSSNFSQNPSMMIPTRNSGVSQSLPRIRRPPLLVMPMHDDYNRQCYLYTHAGSKISHTSTWGINNDVSSRCVGSSKGWLILHQNNDQSLESFLSLFSPLSGNARKIVLPSWNLPSGFKIRWIAKSVLALSPVLSDHKLGVVFLYGVCDYKVALLLMHGVRDNENRWIELESSQGKYADIVTNREFIFALLTSGCVDVWDMKSSLGGSIDKKMKIEIKYPDPVAEFEDMFRDLYTSRFYLVESRGSLLLVVRITGEFVRENGEVVNEGALLDDEEYSHLVLPYKTKNFYVHKLDMRLKKWVRIESLEDQILFLGINESMSLSSLDIQECRGNSIYFTDDNWDHINIHEHDLYGGHDMGVFTLSDKNVEEIFEMRRMVPPPVWIDQDIHVSGF